jgi:hypothetical protein
MLGLSSVSFGQERGYRARANGIVPTTVIPVYGGSVRISSDNGYSGRAGRNNRGVNRPSGYYDYFAGQAVLRSQRLYGLVPGAGYIDNTDMPATPAYIVNPFCQPEFGRNHGAMPEIIVNPFCINSNEEE